MRRRVVITGVGVVSPVGNDVETFWKSLLAGRSGVDFITEFSTEKLRSDIAASVKGFDARSPKEADSAGPRFPSPRRRPARGSGLCARARTRAPPIPRGAEASARRATRPWADADRSQVRDRGHPVLGLTVTPRVRERSLPDVRHGLGGHLARQQIARAADRGPRRSPFSCRR